MIKYLLLSLILLVLVLSAVSQNTEISGKITEAGTGNPIPYANIVLESTYIGTMSDINGNYFLSTSNLGKVVEVSAIGYKKQSVQVNIGQKNILNFELQEEVYALDEIEVKPGENPANILLRRIIENKKNNNPDNFPSWQSRIYAKTEFDIKNVKSSLRNKKLLSQFDFVFDYIDSLEIQGKTFLPVFFNETESNYYHDSETNKDREEVVANKASGMNTDVFSQFTGKMYQDINVYDNYITISDIGFISPVNNLGFQFYKYYLLDSTLKGDSKIYEVSFLPKLAQEPVFKGKIWVEDGSFALARVEMQLSEKANVNFINNLQYKIELQKSHGKWVPRDESIIADVDLQKNKDSEKMGIIFRKNNIYMDFRFGPVTESIVKFKDPIVVASDAAKKDELYWQKIRPVELQEREKNIYVMVDSIKNVPLYYTIAEYIHMFYYGYRDLGKVEIGPYYYVYSKNKVEGSRFRLGARTTFKFDQHLRLNAFGAYGTLDRKWKYGGGAEYFFSVKPLKMISFQGQHDMEMLGKSSNAFMEENIMTTILSKGLNSKLNMVDNYELKAKYEWRNGVISEFSVISNKIYSAPFVPLVNQQGEELSGIQTGELHFGFRYAPGEDIVQDNFERSVFTNYDPTFTVNVVHGIKGFLGGDYNYLKLNASLSDRLRLNPIGYSVYLFQAGKIWGDVPFPYLKIHEGNETYAYDIYAFNLMNYQEFISDTYTSIFWEHHFVGFFLNKVPLFRKLKWREIVGMRSLWGSYNTNRDKGLLLPGNMRSLSKMPYTEFSVGLENIVKFLRVDGVWRFNYNNRTTTRFGVLLTLQITL